MCYNSRLFHLPFVLAVVATSIIVYSFNRKIASVGGVDMHLIGEGKYLKPRADIGAVVEELSNIPISSIFRLLKNKTSATKV